MRALVVAIVMVLGACQEDPGVIVDIDADGGFTRHDAASDDAGD